MVEDTPIRDMDLTPAVVADLKSLADLLERSLAQASLDHEGVRAHLKLAQHRAATTSLLIQEVYLAATATLVIPPAPGRPLDLTQHVLQAGRAVSESEDVPWEWSVDVGGQALARASEQAIITLLDSMLALARAWFPQGGQTTLATSADGSNSWLHLEHRPGPGSPLLLSDGSGDPGNTKSKKRTEQRPPGLAALEYVAQGLDAQVIYEAISGERIRLSAGFPQAAPPERKPTSGLVLLVDDDADSVFMLEQAVEKAGYRTTKAFDGLTALNKARQEDVALVLLDVMLPGMDGYEVLRRLRADPETADLPIVMVSAKSRPEDIDMGMRLGADQYLTKPLRLAQVVSTVEEQIGKPPGE